VTDNLEPVEVRTNGTHPMPEVDSSPPLDREPSFDGVSLDQHFDALLEMVRDWDWRTVSLDTGHAPGDPTTPTETSASLARGPNSPVRAPTPAVEPDVCKDTVEPDRGSVPRGAEPPIAVESMSPRANRDPASADPPPRSLENTAYPAAPIPPPTPSAAEALGAHPPVDSPRGHSKLKVAALYLAGAVAVLIAIGGIRLFA
jgi:hypothetical protein